MILTIPTIFLINGKSKYSIWGLPELTKLDSHFKENPVELAKLFREENNKSILFHCDNSLKSIKVIKNLSESLDIPIQLFVNTNLESDIVKSINKLAISRIFSQIDFIHNFESAIPIVKISELNSFQNYPYQRIMIDFEQSPLRKINSNINVKMSIINSICDTNSLSELNKKNTPIDSIYLGKEYYGTHFAGQLLWRIAEKEQFSI